MSLREHAPPVIFLRSAAFVATTIGDRNPAYPLVPLCEERE
jgi:hypothetical protein